MPDAQILDPPRENAPGARDHGRSSSPADSTAERSQEDDRLVRMFVGGVDRDGACRQLVTRYWKPVVGWVHVRVRSCSDAEEIAQQTFVKAFRSLDRLETPAAFAAWVFRIASNQTTDFLRRRRQTISLEGLLEDSRAPACDEPGVEAQLERRELVAAALEAVGRLPEKYRLVVTMRYCLDLPAKEIAERLGEPEGTIRNRIFRALARLRRALPQVDTERPESR